LLLLLLPLLLQWMVNRNEYNQYLLGYMYQVQVIGRWKEKSEDAETADESASVDAAAAAAAATRRCCGKRQVETPWRTAPAQEHARRNDAPTTAAVLRPRTMTSSGGTLSRSAISHAIPSRRRRSSQSPAAALPVDELLPVVLGRWASKDTSHDRRRRCRLLVRSPDAWWR